MVPEVLYQQSEVLIASVLLAVIVLGAELGYRTGRREIGRHDERTRSQIMSMQAATLGLLSLLLGFTFALSMSRFEIRKQMVVSESNAIGTASLRSHFLPPAQAAEADDLFERYVDIRVESVLYTQQGSSERLGLDREAQRIQRHLWRSASDAAVAEPQSLPLSLFTQAVNELIDSKTRRDVAVANHVPESVLLLLLSLAVLAAVIVGYGNGLAGRRILSLTVAYSVVVVLVIVLILDLDRPQQGLARISQRSMLQLQGLLDARRL